MRLSTLAFRIAAISDLLTQGVPIEDVQDLLAGSEEPRKMGVRDRRRKKEITRDFVERISI
jgi:integrase/recombinase XerD